MSDSGNTEDEKASEVPENIKQYLYDSGLDALEVQRSTDAKHYRWVSKVDGKMRSMATTLAFDAHNVEEFNRPERVTYLKMTRLGI